MKTSVIISDGTFPCSTAPLQGNYRELFPAAAQIGYDAVQLTVNRPEDVDVSLLRSLMQAHGLSVSALATGMGYTVDGLSLGSGSESNRQQAVERMKGHIDLAWELGGAMVIIGAIRGRSSDAESPEAFLRQLHRSVDEVVAYAESKKIVVILEANDHFETDAYITIQDTARYIRSLNSPYFRLHLDTMHMLYEHEEIHGQILDNADILVQVDISGDGRSCPGPEGYDYPAVIQALKEAGFQGYLAFEFQPAPPENAAQAGYQYIRSLLDA